MRLVFPKNEGGRPSIPLAPPPKRSWKDAAREMFAALCVAAIVVLFLGAPFMLGRSVERRIQHEHQAEQLQILADRDTENTAWLRLMRDYKCSQDAMAEMPYAFKGAILVICERAGEVTPSVLLDFLCNSDTHASILLHEHCP